MDTYKYCPSCSLHLDYHDYQLTLQWDECVSHCCLMPNVQFFSYIMLYSIMMMMMAALYKTNMLIWIYIMLAYSLKQVSE